MIEDKSFYALIVGSFVAVFGKAFAWFVVFSIFAVVAVVATFGGPVALKKIKTMRVLSIWGGKILHAEFSEGDEK